MHISIKMLAVIHCNKSIYWKSRWP